VPLGDDAGIFDTLIVGSGAIVMGVVNAEAPSAVLPQGAVPFGVVRFLVATLETVREGGALALVSLIFRDGTCFQTVLPLHVTPLVLWWSLGSEDTG